MSDDTRQKAEIQLFLRPAFRRLITTDSTTFCVQMARCLGQGVTPGDISSLLPSLSAFSKNIERLSGVLHPLLPEDSSDPCLEGQLDSSLADPDGRVVWINRLLNCAGNYLRKESCYEELDLWSLTQGYDSSTSVSDFLRFKHLAKSFSSANSCLRTILRSRDDSESSTCSQTSEKVGTQAPSEHGPQKEVIVHANGLLERYSAQLECHKRRLAGVFIILMPKLWHEHAFSEDQDTFLGKRRIQRSMSAIF